ncbi:hypothetical protein ACUNV4_24775 [Granulosicoccus sp. 3-233]|uniref:hypothetical protein n=1 Tax=Granulosicoccus sp. 3-233 TaxID=3417969 RepID=UPI003D353D65
MRKSLLLCSAAALYLSLSAPSVRADDALLIGGGYNLQGSQGQIELNVKWVQGILQAQGLSVSTYFTDGREAGPDVHYMVDPSTQSSPLEALARVFGDWGLENRRYRENEVAEVLGSTRRNELEPRLRQIFERGEDEELLLVYNGHGSQSYTTPDEVTLNLWDDTTLSASELHELLEPQRSAFRFVFTQCYSGGFHRLAYADSAQGSELSETPRCGFTAESAYRLAEGCSASIDTDDYRDYTTFFFAALSGRERGGDIIGRDPDRNKDGTTTLREAHLYTLEEAYSTDLSRSTSEDYLDQWQPWYLRWLPTSASLPDNEYAALFRNLATRHDVALNDDTRNNLRQALADADQALDSLAGERLSLEQQMQQLQYQLQYRLVGQWPELMGPYTAAYQKMAADGLLREIAEQTERLPEYRQLQQLQDRYASLDLDMLDRERQATQYQKMIRLRRLAQLKQQLAEHGSVQEQADYQALLSCEEAPLTR